MRALERNADGFVDESLISSSILECYDSDDEEEALSESESE